MSELAAAVLTREFASDSFSLKDPEIDEINSKISQKIQEARSLEEEVVGRSGRQSLALAVDSLKILQMARNLKQDAVSLQMLKIQRIGNLVAEEENWLRDCEAALKHKA